MNRSRDWLILSNHLKDKSYVRYLSIIYNIHNDKYLLVKRKNSEYFQTLVDGKYKIGLLPILINNLLPEEKDKLRNIIDTAKVDSSSLRNRLLKDKDKIISCLEKNVSGHQENTFPEKNLIKSEDVIWTYPEKIEEKRIMLDRSVRNDIYRLSVIENLNLIEKENILYTDDISHLISKTTLNKVQTALKDFLSLYNNVYKIENIKTYLGEGKYSLLNTGHVIAVLEEEDNINLKLERIAEKHGNYFAYCCLPKDNRRQYIIVFP